jgi:uncharacterized membrane protein HdeD (DUF308 family)
MREWLVWLLLGLLSAGLGLLALGNLMAASIAVATVTGAVLLIAGAFQAAAGLRGHGRATRAAGIGAGVLIGLLGIAFLADPLRGTVSLAFLVTIGIGLAGILRLAMAWGMRASRYYWLMLVSGALSILLAGVILASWPAASAILLGAIVGLELLFNGLALVVLALFLRARDAG